MNTAPPDQPTGAPATGDAHPLPAISRSGVGLAEDNSEPFCSVQGERALWRAVIVQALMDASCGSRKPEAQQWKQDALIWLRGNSANFHTVAYHAGFEPDYLREMIAGSLEKGCQWRALPGEGTRIRTDRQKSTRAARQRR